MDRYETDVDEGCRRVFVPGSAVRLPRPLSAVVFDLDGTLLDTEQLYRAAFNAALAELGWTLPDIGYNRLIGLPSTARHDVLADLLGPAFPLADFFAAYARHRTVALGSGVPLKPGVAEALDALDEAGLAYAIATSASRRTAQANLAASGLLHRMSTVVTRDDVTQGKPHPDSFLLAAARLEQPPERCLAVEDSAPGVAAAFAAGMMVAMIPDAVPPTEAMLDRCAVRLGSLLELPPLLGLHTGELARINDRSPVRV